MVAGELKRVVSNSSDGHASYHTPLQRRMLRVELRAVACA